jgi:hypothetical protein
MAILRQVRRPRRRPPLQNPPTATLHRRSPSDLDPMV